MTFEQEQKLLKAAENDEKYNALLEDCFKLEPEYERIMDTLSETDRKILEKYIYLCEELEYRRTSLAMDL